MKLEFQHNELGSGPNGLEISVHGFKSNPGDAYLEPVQVFVEAHEGKLKVHVWDGNGFDPVSTIIEPSDGE